MSRVGTQIGCHHLLLKEFFCTWHDLCEHTAPFEFFNEIFHNYINDKLLITNYLFTITNYELLITSLAFIAQYLSTEKGNLVIRTLQFVIYLRNRIIPRPPPRMASEQAFCSEP